MEVLNVYITTKKFIVSVYGGGAIEVPRKEYEEWADENQKREWISVTADHNGNPVEDSGTLSWRNYFKDADFRKDMGQYIDKKKLIPQ